MQYHLVTLGCQMNKSDSERVRTVLEGMGYAWTDREDQADILGILSCSVRQKSIDRVYSRVSGWNRLKNSRNPITFVSGCLLEADRMKFLKLFDLVFSIEELKGLPEMIRQYGIVTPFSHGMGQKTAGQAVPETARPIRQFWKIPPSYQSAFEAFVPIQNGCDKFCSFCAVPYTRGREISRPSDEILDEVSGLISQGYRSITLLGQNVNSYGRDKKGDEICFPELLNRIGRMGEASEREFWVYFTSPHPRDMTDQVIEAVSRYRCLARQIHLPLQSGDDRVLIRMNRRHSLDRYRQIVRTIRRHIPEATLFTDIIVGFSGESEEQFENTREAMAEFRYNMAYIAVYSPRQGAASYRWEDDVPLQVKKDRLHKLTEELRIHASAHNAAMTGKTFRVLVTGQDRGEGYLSGHTEGRIPVRFPSGDNSMVGKFVWMTVSSASDFSVEGNLAGSPEPRMIRQ